MGFSQINSISSRISRANVMWVSVALLLLNVYLVYSAYADEKHAIDAKSMEHFGTSVSSSMSFSEILNSSGYSIIAAFIISVIIFWIPTMMLIVMGKKIIVEELHAGWKRIAIVVPSLFAIWVSVAVDIDGLLGIHIPWVLQLLIPVTIGLALVALTRWVFKGFEKS